MTDRELMQMALDALEGYARNCQCEGGGAPCDAAEALRARLVQPEQEPLAWWQPNEYKIEKSFSKTTFFCRDCKKVFLSSIVEFGKIFNKISNKAE